MRRSVSVNATKEGVVRFPVWQVGLALVLGGNLKNPQNFKFRQPQQSEEAEHVENAGNAITRLDRWR